MFMLTAPGTPPPVGSFENKRDRLHLEKKKKLLFRGNSARFHDALLTSQ